MDLDKAQQWDSRGHFFAAAAEAMRRILVDHAREKGSAKRGGTLKRLDIDAVNLATKAAPDQLLAIDAALAKLAREDSSAAKLVELRDLAGLTVDEAGSGLGADGACTGPPDTTFFISVPTCLCTILGGRASVRAAWARRLALPDSRKAI